MKLCCRDSIVIATSMISTNAMHALLQNVSVTQMKELEEIRSGLSRCGATFFVREDAACSR